MAFEKDEEFIIDVHNFVKENPGSKAKEILKVLKQSWPEKKKKNVNSALYTLKHRGAIDSDDNGGAPSWGPSNPSGGSPDGDTPYPTSTPLSKKLKNILDEY